MYIYNLEIKNKGVCVGGGVTIVCGLLTVAIPELEGLDYLRDWVAVSSARLPSSACAQMLVEVVIELDDGARIRG